ncbi:MAG: SDR family oxidoreductase [Actinobacteria bacterium]|nr:SDR family oxidoreductase [Actinomycetota bacterium]
MQPLDEQRILLTGVAGGIGKPVTNLLLKLGAQVIGVDIANHDSVRDLLKHPKFTYYQIDLAEAENIEKLMEILAKSAPDSLVALAGIVVSGELVLQSSSDVERVINLNLTSQINLSKSILSLWLEKNIKGNIVFVSSWVDHVPWPGITPYAASKAGLVAVCRGIAREYARDGIRANLISPGIVDVGMAAKQWREEPDYKARASRAIPLGRLQQPEEVAEGIAFLLSSQSQYMTGSNLLIDGGASLYPLDPEEVDKR